jgi:WXXGXW repeat (2 copies)
MYAVKGYRIMGNGKQGKGLTKFLASAVVGLAALLAVAHSGWADSTPSQQDGAEVLARGPVHEAFAQPMNTQPEAGPVAPKPPPEPVDEVPPDQKPEGDNVQWIPGYWSWDEDRSDYLWVSGFWRSPPPGRRWLAGHWQPIENGWQWVAGLWAPENAEEVQYLPPPPPTLDQGPSTPAPDDNSTYVPGCWFYQQTRYFWRPGYWVGNRPNWVWCSAGYTWTPSGCLFNDGYWDHPLDERGLLFAPVYFSRDWGRRPFVPQFVVSSDFLMGAMFVCSSAQHYYFGDYFDKRYAARGFVTWPEYRVGKTGYDANYNYYRHLHAADPRWETSLRDLYRTRASGEVPRPPRTLIQQVRTINTITGNKTGNDTIHKNINLTHIQNVTALAPLKGITKSRVTNLSVLSPGKDPMVAGRVMKLEPVPKEEHAREVQKAGQLRAAGQLRHDVESKMLNQGGVPVIHTDPARVVKMELPKPIPPVAAPRPVLKVTPPLPGIPKHEERPIPKFTPSRPPGPPKPGKP